MEVADSDDATPKTPAVLSALELLRANSSFGLSTDRRSHSPRGRKGTRWCDVEIPPA
jgi:hypothetical protein